MSEIKRYIEARDIIIGEAIAAGSEDGDLNAIMVHAFAAALDAGFSPDEANEIAKEAADRYPLDT